MRPRDRETATPDAGSDAAHWRLGSWAPGLLVLGPIRRHIGADCRPKHRQTILWPIASMPWFFIPPQNQDRAGPGQQTVVKSYHRLFQIRRPWLLIYTIRRNSMIISHSKLREKKPKPGRNSRQAIRAVTIRARITLEIRRMKEIREAESKGRKC